MRMRSTQRAVVAIEFCLLAAASVFTCKTPPKKIPDESVMYTIKINGKVPYIVGEEELNSLIKTRSVERYREFEEAAKMVGIRVETTDEVEETDEIKELNFNLAWKAGRRDWDVVSMVIFVTWDIDESSFLGAESFTWDVNNKTLLFVENILPYTRFKSLEELSAYAKKKLLEKLDPKNTDPALQKMIDRVTAPKQENYSVFLLEPEGITFYFNGLGCDIFVSL